MANMIFNLDLNKNNAINHIIFGRLTDGNLRKITVNITNEGEPVDLTDWVIRFEGVTGGHTKVFDVIGVHLLDAENGKFEYTFSKTAFSASGAYKSAYFAIEKDNMRETTNDIRIIVENVADLDAKDAETVVTELNKTITLINQKYDELNNRVDIYEDDIAELDDWLASRKAEIEDLIDLANSNFSEKLTEIQSKLDATNKEFSILKSDLESLQSAVNNQSATVSTKANQTDLDNLKTDVTSQGVAISTKAEQADLLITNQNVTTAQTTANKAETDAQTAIAKATEAQANSLSLNGNAVSASKLATARKLGVSLQSPTYQNFNGTADVTNIGVSGVLPIANGGTGTSGGVINTIAYSWSADGTDRFTTVYPNLNLLDGTKDFSGAWTNSEVWTTDGTYNGLTVKKKTTQWNGIYKTFTAPKDGDYTFSAYVKSSGSSATIYRYAFLNDVRLSKILIGNNFDWFRDSLTLNLKANDTAFIRYEITGDGTDSILWNAGHKWEEGSTATLWMPSPSEATTADYPSYIGYSNTIKPNKTSSDYKWLPMGLVSIDSATGLLKPAVIGIDYAQAHPIGSVVSNNSNSSSGYMTGIWENIGSAVIGSTTIYYWQRTA